MLLRYANAVGNIIVFTYSAKADGGWRDIYAFDLIIFIKSFVSHTERNRHTQRERMSEWAIGKMERTVRIHISSNCWYRCRITKRERFEHKTQFFTNANYHSKTNQKINLNMIMALKSTKQFTLYRLTLALFVAQLPHTHLSKLCTFVIYYSRIRNMHGVRCTQLILKHWQRPQQ